MATEKAKAFRITDTSREILQNFIKEQIPQEAKFVLASPTGYLFMNEEPAITSAAGTFRLPHFAMLSYYDIEYELD